MNHPPDAPSTKEGPVTQLQLVLGVIRLPFLILAPACVLLGIACAQQASDSVSFPHAVLALLGGLLAHASVNALNEYSDFKSGLDLKTIRTPFSGGSGALAQNPGLAPQALVIGLATLAGTALIGVFFVLRSGWMLLPLGLVGLLTIAIYTPLLSRSPFLCLIAPGLGFGPLMVVGTSFVLTGRYTTTAVVASLIPFFLVSDLLLLNQFPDASADRTVGRRHLVIAAGLRTSAFIYSLFLGCAYATIVLGVWSGVFPKASLLGLLTVPLAVAAARGAYRHGADVPRLIPSMGLNVLVNVATPLLVAVGLWIG
jgi:1,4-dihydroxy-2-naphthoate octaprenyltransferase